MTPNARRFVAGAWCAALLFATGAAGAARAADVAVLPVRATNLTPGESDAIGILLANAYETEARVTVARPSDVAQTIAASGSLEAALAKLGAREYLDTTAVRLSTRIAVHVARHDASGTTVHAAEMTAESLDDMQPVAIRLSRALALRTTVQATRTIDDVTRRETRVPNRMFTDKVMGLKTALTWTFADGRDFDPALSLQFDGRLERDRGFLEFGAGAAIPSNGNDSGIGGVFAEFGGSLYLNRASTSPYVGAGVMPRLLFTSDGGGVSAAAYGQAGLMFMRDASSRLYVEVRVSQEMMGLDQDLTTYDPTTGTATSSDTIYPTQVGLQLGIGW